MTSGNAGAGPDPGGNGALEKSGAPLFCGGRLWYNNRKTAMVTQFELFFPPLAGQPKNMEAYHSGFTAMVWQHRPGWPGERMDHVWFGSGRHRQRSI